MRREDMGTWGHGDVSPVPLEAGHAKRPHVPMSPCLTYKFVSKI